MTPRIRINTELSARRLAVNITSGRHSRVGAYRNPHPLTEPVVENRHMSAISTERHPIFATTSGSSNHRKHMLPNKRGSAIKSRAPNRYAELIANQNYGERAKQQAELDRQKTQDPARQQQQQRDLQR